MTPDVPGGSPPPLDRLLAYLAKDAEGFRAIGNDFQAEEIEVWRDLVSQSATQRAEAREAEALKLAACDVMALSNTRNAFEQAKIDAMNPAWSVAYASVRLAVAREIALRERAEAAEARAEQLAASVQTLQQEREALRKAELPLSVLLDELCSRCRNLVMDLERK